MPVHNRGKEVEDIGEDGEGSHKEGEDGQRLQLVWQTLDGKPGGAVVERNMDYNMDDLPEDEVGEDSSEEAGEIDGGEVVVEVEDAPHEEEGKIMHCPRPKQFSRGNQVDAGQIVHVVPNSLVGTTPSGLEKGESENEWAK